MRNYKLLSSLGLVFVLVISCGSNKKKKGEGLVTDTENQMKQNEGNTIDTGVRDTVIYHHGVDDSAMSKYKDSVNQKKRLNQER